MVAFNKTKGAAQKGSFPQYEYKMGENRVRLVGEVLPRYIYWVEGENKKNIPMECLSFDREQEAFTNKEKDWVREYFPDLKCGWAYVMLGLVDGELQVVNLKKKLMQQIIEVSQELGDPTDPDEGWEVVFKREKTGPNVYNVEYTILPFKCKDSQKPLTDAEKALVEEADPISTVLSRPTPDAQKELLERITNATQNVDEDAVDEHFDVS